MSATPETTKDEVDGGRRGFLKMAALAAPATAAGAVAGGTGAEAAEAAPKAAGLRRTPHVEAYLKAARF